MLADTRIARSLTWRYAIALALVATLATAAWLSLHLVIAKQESVAAVVNVSGRQRMLSQRTALFSSLLISARRQERQTVRRLLAESADLLRRSHRGLTRGDEAMGLPSTLSPTVRAMYFDLPMALDGQVEAYLRSVDALLQLKDDELRPDHPLLQYIVTVSPTQLVSALDRMVWQYQQEGEEAVSRLQRTETVVWLLTLLLLALEAAFIFHPFARHVHAVIGKLKSALAESGRLQGELRQYQGNLEELVRQRTEELQKKSAELAESEERFRLISTSAKDAILIIDRDEAIVYWNPAAGEIFGYAAEEVLGRNMHDLLAPHRYQNDIRRGFGHFRATGEGAMIGRTVEVMALRKGGEEFPIELSISTLRLGGSLHALGIVRDVTGRKQMETELRSLATTDALTGLPNRRHFLVRLEEQLARLQRLISPPAAVLMLDLDHFKQINDSHGHATGDAVLAHVAGLLRNGLRKIDTVGRLGGEEFAFILPGTDAAGAGIFAERLRRKLEEQPFRLGERLIPVTVSIGIAAMTPADAGADAALARADAALYRAKECGRNRVEHAREGAESP